MASRMVHVHDLKEFVRQTVDVYCDGDLLLHPAKIRERLANAYGVNATDEEIVEALFSLCKTHYLHFRVMPGGSIEFFGPPE